jgi:hypothetical protein
MWVTAMSDPIGVRQWPSVGRPTFAERVAMATPTRFRRGYDNAERLNARVHQIGLERKPSYRQRDTTAMTARAQGTTRRSPGRRKVALILAAWSLAGLVLIGSISGARAETNVLGNSPRHDSSGMQGSRRRPGIYPARRFGKVAGSMVGDDRPL